MNNELFTQKEQNSFFLMKGIMMGCVVAALSLLARDYFLVDKLLTYIPSITGIVLYIIVKYLVYKTKQEAK